MSVVKDEALDLLLKVVDRPDIYAAITDFDPKTLVGDAQIVDTVYLLHFDEPYPGGKRPQHYLGHATAGRFALRLAEHRNGSNKARLTQVFAELGIGFVIARTWAGDYDLERALKRRHRPAALCPICRGEA